MFLSLALATICLPAFSGCNQSGSEGGASASDRPPKAPDNLWAEISDDNDVELFWDDNSDNEDGFIIMRRKLSTTTFRTLTDINSSDVEYYMDIDTGFSTTYYYSVQAYNAVGWSEPSNVVKVRTPNMFGFGGDARCGCLGIEPFILLLLIIPIRKRLRQTA